jgi:DNA (cytosine-5)-methyltransferase 1
VLLGADSDPLAVETHRANLGSLGYAGDLADPSGLLDAMRAWGMTSVDLIAGGPPCQPFSRAGKSKIRDLVSSGARSADDPRARLWRGFMQVVARVEPRVVLVENVPDLPHWDGGAALIGFYEGFRELGYRVDARVLEALNHGIPQHRARLFIVARKDGLVTEWPAIVRSRVTLREAIGDLPPVPPGQREEEVPYEPRPSAVGRFWREMRKGSSKSIIHDHLTRAVRPDDHEAFELLREGDIYSDLPERLRRYRSDIFNDKYKRLAWDEVSRSITAHIAKDGYWYIHPEQHRTLSVREAARVQSFPDWFRFAGEPTHRLRQIGNAVPPLLAEQVGRSLLPAKASRRRATVAGSDAKFRNRLLDWHATNARTFPWRGRDVSPWAVLMAEMCLHRTRADQVVPVFEALCRIAPTPRRMITHEPDALEAMRSLGLRWRAENIVGVARELVDRFRGRVPETEEELLSLPGVGDYVAQAVMCFAFDKAAVLMDTNTTRIASRIRGTDDTRRWQIRLDLYRLAGPQGPDAEFNYALLDLGALRCRASAPICNECPVRAHCATGSGRGSTVAELELEEAVG